MEPEDVSKVEILGVATPEPPRRRWMIIVISLVLALVLAGGAAWSLTRDRGDAETATGDSLGIEGLRTYVGLASDHVVGDVDYPQSPPVGGPHDQVWLACGVYDEPVRDENLVHDLEHGAVFIAYRPGLSDDEIETLTKALPSTGLMAPYPGLSSPVVLTAWGLQVAVDGADDPRVQQFLDRFGHGEAAPELGVSCAGGTTDPQGGYDGVPSPTPSDPGTSV